MRSITKLKEIFSVVISYYGITKKSMLDISTKFQVSVTCYCGARGSLRVPTSRLLGAQARIDINAQLISSMTGFGIHSHWPPSPCVGKAALVK